MFLKSFDYFRGIAIIFVVLAHSYGPAGWQPTSSVWDTFLFNLMMNGTVFFMFISGFLFHHVFVPRYQFRTFIEKKSKFVLLPYLLLSLLPIAFWLLWAEGGAPHTQFSELQNEFLLPIWYLLSGRHLTAYWFIPMIMVLFLLTPLVCRLDRADKLLHAVIPLLLVALFVHRPTANLNALQSLVYFAPVYLLGAWASKYKEFIYHSLSGKEWLLVLVALVFATIQTLGTEQLGNSHKPFFLYAGIDWSLLQKLVLCFALMVWLHRFEETNWTWLSKLADVSFAIYFIHPWFTVSWNRWVSEPAFEQGNLLTTLFVCGVLIIFSMLTALLVRALAGKRSRNLIGW